MVAVPVTNGNLGHSCKSGQAFRVGLGFDPDSGLKLTNISGLIRA